MATSSNYKITKGDGISIILTLKKNSNTENSNSYTFSVSGALTDFISVSELDTTHILTITPEDSTNLPIGTFETPVTYHSVANNVTVTHRLVFEVN